jgi:hypothetical protein
MRKLKTINLKGKEYVQVQERVKVFNEEYPHGKIETSAKLEGNTVIFKATVTPDTEKPERKFNGHSFGELGKEKALEKLETVSIGRALAFMGIGIVEGIASADEMARFNQPSVNQSTGELETPTCSICGKPMKLSMKGKYYCKHGDKWGDKVWQGKAPISKQEKDFIDSMPEPEPEQIKIEDLQFN